MHTVTINLPDEAEPAQVKMIIAVSLFEKGIISSGQAAEIVGMNRRMFLEEVGKFGVSIFGESIDDLHRISDLEI